MLIEKNLVEICGDIKHDTEDAILLSDGVNFDWLPRSQIKIRKLSNGYEVIMPEWLAKKKGFI